jgi:hypothetical protein
VPTFESVSVALQMAVFDHILPMSKGATLPSRCVGTATAQGRVQTLSERRLLDQQADSFQLETSKNLGEGGANWSTVAWAAGRIGWLDRRGFSTSRSGWRGCRRRATTSNGGRPPFDHVLMFKVMILQTQNNLSDERTEFYLRDRLTWMRFLDLGLAEAVPDANTIWTFARP